MLRRMCKGRCAKADVRRRMCKGECAKANAKVNAKAYAKAYAKADAKADVQEKATPHDGSAGNSLKLSN